MKFIYRPEIDGLRAIAVSAVILYHAKIKILGHSFKGGFIGVDIFFVISGYLITSIILKELFTTGAFSFKNFYERRVRRILPALLLVMLVSLFFAWIVLVPESFIDFAKSILYSLGFSSNFYFHYSGQQYGAESGLLKPFLHTWSLSVEEQYYILFPIILLFIFKYFRQYIIHTLFIGFLISLSMADWGSKNYPSVSFYFIHTRMWELLMGSILAYFELTLGHRSKHKTLNLILPSIGLLLIGHSILFFNDKMFHPSFYTLSPIIGVCLIIWFSNKDELITKILSTKLFVCIGLISYSLYLWHYPVFAFLRIGDFLHQGSIFKILLTAVVILSISIISYFFIERPFRDKKNKSRVIFGVILITSSFLVILNLNIVTKEGYKNRIPEILQKNLAEGSFDNLLENLDSKYNYCNIDGCKFNTSSNKKIYIIGDSHAGTLIYYLKDRIIKNQYQLITSTFSGCLYFPGFDSVTVKTQKIDNDCNKQYFQKLKKTLLKEKNSIIIFGGRFPLYLSNYFFNNQEGGIEGVEWKNKYISTGEYDTIQNSFISEVSELSNDNKIILIYPIPEVGWDPNKIFFYKYQLSKIKFFKGLISEYVTTSYKVFKDRTNSSFELLDTIQGDNIYRVYPHKLFCDSLIKDRCIANDDKNFFYRDDDHPSEKGAKLINNLIMQEIEKIELKSN